MSRSRQPFAEACVRDLEWLGLEWDGEVVYQSRRTRCYQEALSRLQAMGRLYPCTCSRKDIREASSAPHQDTPRYPETCRMGSLSHPKQATCLRLRTEPSDPVVCHHDRLFGAIQEDIYRQVGDFVLQRRDGLFAYQLAVVVDDLEQGVTCIVRGNDLLASMPRQILLRTLLKPNARPLESIHLPLVRNAEGTRLAKRDRPPSIQEYQRKGGHRDQLIGRLAHALGLIDRAEPCQPSDLVPLWDTGRLPKDDIIWREA